MIVVVLLLKMYKHSVRLARDRYKIGTLSGDLNTALLPSIYKHPFWVRYLAAGLYLEISHCLIMLCDDNVFFIGQPSRLVCSPTLAHKNHIS